MKIIHSMAMLCALTITLNATNQETDAQTIARTIKAHIKNNIDPQCYLLQRELKAITKSEINEAKKAMKEAQKKIYADFIAIKADLNQAQSQEMAQLKSFTQSKNNQRSLKDILNASRKYLDALISHAQRMNDKKMLELLKEEGEWLNTIEKTSLQAGISLTEELTKKEPKQSKPQSSKKHSLIIE